MALPIYPAGLPHPIREGYGFDSPDMILRTPMLTGRARQRVAYVSSPDFVDAVWIVRNNSQAQLLKAWAAQVAGAGWFTMNLSSDMGIVPETVRFTETLKGPYRVGNRYWSFRARIEVQERPMVAPGWAEILPDYILMADIFDRAVNFEWPQSKYQTYMGTFDFAVNEEWPQ